MGHSLQLKLKKDNRFKIQCLEKVFPINLRMAFLVKYLAFVVAFLSAAKLGECINVKLVDPTNAESIQEYADLVKKDVCESFDPLNSSHMDAIGDDATTLARLLTVHYQGDNIDICTPGGRSLGQLEQYCKSDSGYWFCGCDVWINFKILLAIPEGRIVIATEYLRIFSSDHYTIFSFVDFCLIPIWMYNQNVFI